MIKQIKMNSKIEDTLATKYNPKEIEDKWYSFWEDEKLFHSVPDSSKKPYTIVIPPPNITGVLHIGHALNNTLQDILVRWRRMQGFNSLWMPGTDHAGIATQNVVERALAKDGADRESIGRDGFIKKVWEWREKYGSTITKQLKKLGSACDWDRERFTMDDGLSSAVRETFVQLYDKGLIYKGNYVINWCPRCTTALADDEVDHEEHEGHLWYIKYPFKDNPHLHLTVATTRPETMLGDVAVAVNPDDPRYNEMIGEVLILPIVDREIKIYGDEFVDKEFGTGAVKITPAHDNNDFEMSLRHNLKPIVVLNDDGTMNSNAGDYDGVDRFECREAIIQELKRKDFIVKVDPHIHSVGHCYRCNTVIEPYLSDQWFVRMKPLAKAAIKAANDDVVKFYPERWSKVYLSWLENVRDWCISRQIWWGHRIPAWYCEDCNEINVRKEEPKECSKCKGSRLRQEDDVLDTWFSSALWPFSTMGWPDKTEELDYYYPTSTLVTDRGIIYFWVARMVMMGLEMVDKVPFNSVYIHGTILDEIGRKMSKSLGNGIDPLEMIDQFGADAVRVSLIMLTSEGQDVKLSESKFEMGRNFANKVWNASRFALMNIGGNKKLFVGKIESRDCLFEDYWILSKLNTTIKSATDFLEKFKFNDSIKVIYDFFWHDFCDWYLEIVKPRIYKNDGDDGNLDTDKSVKSQIIAQNNLVYVLDKTLRLLHPFAPFLTEEIWQRLKDKAFDHGKCDEIEALSCSISDIFNRGDMDHKSIMDTLWPEDKEKLSFPEIENDMELLQNIIRSVRNIRSKMNILQKQAVKVLISVPGNSELDVLNKHKEFLNQNANLESLEIGVDIEKPENAASEVIGQVQIFLPLVGLVDTKVETERQQKRLAELEKYLKIVKGKLGNKNFVDKAPEEVVTKEREREKELLDQIDKVKVSIGADIN